MVFLLFLAGDTAMVAMDVIMFETGVRVMVVVSLLEPSKR